MQLVATLWNNLNEIVPTFVVVAPKVELPETRSSFW